MKEFPVKRTDTKGAYLFRSISLSLSPSLSLPLSLSHTLKSPFSFIIEKPGSYTSLIKYNHTAIPVSNPGERKVKETRSMEAMRERKGEISIQYTGEPSRLPSHPRADTLLWLLARQLHEIKRNSHQEKRKESLYFPSLSFHFWYSFACILASCILASSNSLSNFAT